MNLRRGMDRIALALSILALAVGGILGSIHSDCDTSAMEGISYKKSAEDHLQGEKQPVWIVTIPQINMEIEFPGDMELDEINAVIRRQVYGCFTSQQRAGVIIVTAIAAFLVVFFGLRGVTRLIVWIFEGFRSE